MVTSISSYTAIDLPGGWVGYVFSPGEESVGTCRDIALGRWRAWLVQLVSDPSALLGYQVLKYSRTREVVRARLPAERGTPDEDLEVVCKHSEVEGWGRRLLRASRCSRAHRDFDRARMLPRIGIDTARPLALLEKRLSPRSAWLVTEYLANVVDLDQAALNLLPQCPPHRTRAIKNRLIHAVAKCFALLRRHKLHHRDLKASNLLIAHWDDPAAPARVYVVDLEGLRGRRWWKPREWRQPLIRLAASLLSYRSITRSDYARFLRSYLSCVGFAPGEWKDLFYTVAPQADRYARRSQTRKANKLDGYAGNG